MNYNPQDIITAYNTYGSFTRTAEVLGINRKTVRKYVNEYHENESFAAHEATRTGVPFSKVGHYWLKTKNEDGDDVSLFVKNSQDIMEYEELRDKLVEHLSKFAPTPPKIKRNHINNGRLLVLDPADIHIGKLAKTEETGDEYNINEACERVTEGVADILDKAHMFNIEHIVVVLGNDILHIDNPRRGTTAGTPQDTDGQWWEMFERARELYVTIIEMAKETADVTLIYCPSNHDYAMGFNLTDSLYSWYRNDPNVTISKYGKSIRHRKYIRYGSNLIGFTHGDGAKNKDLVNLMQLEAREDWALTKFSYWYVHHLHHKYRIVNNVEVEKDNIGVTTIGNHSGLTEHNTSIECIRSPSSADGWHDRNGYKNLTAIEAYIHDPKYGQIARLTSYV